MYNLSMFRVSMEVKNLNSKVSYLLCVLFFLQVHSKHSSVISAKLGKGTETVSCHIQKEEIFLNFQHTKSFQPERIPTFVSLGRFGNYSGLQASGFRQFLQPKKETQNDSNW